MVLLAIGDMSAELTRRNTEIFAREVIPHFRKAAAAQPENPAPAQTPAR